MIGGTQFGGGENTRCRTCLDEISRTYSEPVREEFSVFVRARNPSVLAVVPCTLSAVDKCGRRNVGLHKHTHKHTQTEKVVQGSQPYPRMRSDMKRLFLLAKPRKNGSALRASRASLLSLFRTQWPFVIIL